MHTLSALLQQSFPTDTLVTIVAAIAVAAVGWLILRFVLKMAWRAFVIGCVGILILGLVFAGAAYLLGS